MYEVVVGVLKVGLKLLGWGGVVEDEVGGGGLVGRLLMFGGGGYDMMNKVLKIKCGSVDGVRERCIFELCFFWEMCCLKYG